MWDSIKEILVSPNAWMFLLFLVFATFVLTKMSKSGLISFKGKGLRIGSDETERTIIRNQTQWARLYIMSIKGKILPANPNKIQRLTAEVILEKVYDNVSDWITYNHISSNNSYIEIKQSEIKCLVYAQDDLEEEFKTPEFATRMESWVKELILNLIQIRKEYLQNGN